ncbi:MAG TPA: GNAT family N-acetyltransferase [Candidatus Eremiobacteraceae bacterium]|nr:GNAT family N-acetyltransferase [Candidatus Eremiobacteraceae bacterium]
MIGAASGRGENAVRRITRVPMEEWQASDAASPAPTFFARPGWARALASADPRFKVSPARCEFADGTFVDVPLVAERGRLGWTEYSGLPLETYTIARERGGALATPERATEAFRAIVRRLGQRCRITPWPAAYADIDISDCENRARETSLIDVSGGAEAAIDRMEGVVRRMAGQAERRGVVCARVADPVSAVDEYYAMLTAAAARWERGRPSFSKALLRAVVEYGGPDVEIWFARFENAPIAGGVVLFGSEELMFWSAAMLSEQATLRPSNALNVALIRRAAERGVRWYNLGSSEGLPGVKRFKEGLGAFSVAYKTFERTSALYAAYRKLRAKKK